MKHLHYFDLVYDLTCCIPKGRVTTYGAIADYLSLGSARMVGWALNRLLATHAIPAHRVVNRKGELSGRAHFNPPSLMQELLEAEGIRIENNQVLDFKEKFWHPAELEKD
ncbi:MAG: MGMT family protein [Saprospiraceae bacterium]|nr:MGMT family protein [Saprospiraceae bacterium]MDP4821345.1 MGMT family protein [Saprospiraceae bacterium]MDP4998632.1 MGMT family protein [Saprospiraceae bacterium]